VKADTAPAADDAAAKEAAAKRLQIK
jgi:hypothetical protein